MQSNVIQMPLTSWKEQLQAVDYQEAEQQFVTLLELEDLDKKLEIQLGKSSRNRIWFWRWTSRHSFLTENGIFRVHSWIRN